MRSLLTQRFLGNEPLSWVIAVGATALLFVVFLFINRLIGRKLKALATRTDTKIDDLFAEVLSRTSPLVLLVISAVAGSQALTLRPVAQSLLVQGVWLAVLVQIGLWGNGAVSFWLERSMQQASGSPAGSTATMTAIGFVARLALWSLVILVGLSNLGVDITGLIAGLGIGGIAVALALQNVLGDLFASLSIVLDKPFVIGDFIVVDQLAGTVEYVGLKTTRIRSLSGEQLIVSNADLLRSRIRNFKRMQERRILFTFGVTYQTPTESMAKVAQIAQDVIRSQSGARFDRAHFKEFGESSLIYECVYFVLSPDYNVYMDVQQSINIGLARALQSEEIEFAYPTRTVIIQHAASTGAAAGGGSGGTS